MFKDYYGEKSSINSAYRRRSMETIFFPRQWQYFNSHFLYSYLRNRVSLELYFWGIYLLILTA